MEQDAEQGDRVFVIRRTTEAAISKTVPRNCNLSRVYQNPAKLRRTPRMHWTPLSAPDPRVI